MTRLICKSSNNIATQSTQEIGTQTSTLTKTIQQLLSSDMRSVEQKHKPDLNGKLATFLQIRG